MKVDTGDQRRFPEGKRTVAPMISHPWLQYMAKIMDVNGRVKAFYRCN